MNLFLALPAHHCDTVMLLNSPSLSCQFSVDYGDRDSKRFRKRIIKFRRRFVNKPCAQNRPDLLCVSGCVNRTSQIESDCTITMTSEGSGLFSTRDTLFLELRQCIKEGNLAGGRTLHLQIINCGLQSDAFFGSHLIQMFTHFGSLWEANQVFLRLPNPSVYTWGAIILAHVKLGHNGTALRLYHELLMSSIIPDGHIFVSILKRCIKPTDFSDGILIHSQAVEYGLEFDDFVGSALVEMYSKCGSQYDAHIVFDRMPKRNVITCSLLMGGYVQQGKEDIALELFMELIKGKAQLDEVTYIYALRACSNISSLQQGRKVHLYLLESGLNLGLSVGNAVIDMYVKCQSLYDATVVFNRLHIQDVIAWTSLLAGYAQQGYGKEALHLFHSMRQHGINPTPITLVLILRACCSIAEVRKIHTLIIENGVELEEFAGSSLIDMYGKCGSLQDARTLFKRIPKPDVITWSAYIARIAENGHSEEACKLYEEMLHEGLVPDKVTFICILKACSGVGCLEHGRRIHQQVVGCGFGMDVYLGNALIDMYVKCQSLEDACLLSNKLPMRNVVTWSLLIGGYVQEGFPLEALQVFDKMNQEGIELDEISFLSALKACSKIAALKQGRYIHGNIIEKGYGFNSYLSSALIDMYTKCGSNIEACRTFERSPKQNVVIWSSLMTGYAQTGDYSSVVNCFENMQKEGLQPDEVSFLSLLIACSQKGIVDEGCMNFKLMRDEYGLTPSIMHYNTMVDLLGHARCLKEVEDMLETIPFPCNLVGWTSLLTSCKTHLNVEIGRRSFDNFGVLDRGNATGYVLMSNIYSQVNMLEEAEEIEELRKYANAWKMPGKAFIEIGDEIHDFIVGDKTHPESRAIYDKLGSLNLRMKEEGYRPRVDLVMEKLSDENKESALCGHCEKLAIAFGLISTPQGSTIRVSKNLRMCADCHDTTKMVSKLEMREIIVVDAYCIHNFSEGVCSCQGLSLGT